MHTTRIPPVDTATITRQLVVGVHGFLSSMQSSTTAASLPADIAEHVRMDVQTDIGHIVKVLAGNQPNDLADLALGIMAN
jgi:hypothetical protein